MNEPWPCSICLNGPQGQEAPIFFLEEVTSSLDEAWKMIAEGRLPVWGSLLAKSQSRGRGRMGRVWQSPPGHLYAALRLPADVPPFDGPGASLAMALLLSAALNDFALGIKIKWPNDLISPEGKVGGILLEARKKSLVAGIGLNFQAPPEGEWTRDPRSLPPAALKFTVGPKIFWAQLAEKVFLHYNGLLAGEKSGRLVTEAEKLLLWKGETVLMEQPSTEPVSHSSQLIGEIKGLAEGGALILENEMAAYKVWSGSLYKI